MNGLLRKGAVEQKKGSNKSSKKLKSDKCSGKKPLSLVDKEKTKGFDDLCADFQDLWLLTKRKSEKASGEGLFKMPVFKKLAPPRVDVVKRAAAAAEHGNVFLSADFPSRLLVDEATASNSCCASSKRRREHFGADFTLFFNPIANKFSKQEIFSGNGLPAGGSSFSKKRKLAEEDECMFTVKRRVEMKPEKGDGGSKRDDLLITILNDAETDVKKKKKKQKTVLCDYKKVFSNVYVGCKPNQVNSEPILCSCTDPEDGCFKNCLNRMTYTECNNDFCNLKEKCSNRRIQNRKWVKKLELFKTVDNRGNGVRARELIPRGTFVVEYVGEVIKEDEFKRRMEELYKTEVNHYTLSLDSGLVIDSYRVGSLARFINHSCEPNCEVQKWLVNGQYRMCIFAIRDIQPGIELTYDYKFHSFNTENMQVCNCGASRCRGYVGSLKQASSKGLKNSSRLKSDEMKKMNFYYCSIFRKLPSKVRDTLSLTQSLLKGVDEMTKREAGFVQTHAIFLKRNRCKFLARMRPKGESLRMSEQQARKGNVELIKAYLNLMKTNSNFVFTRRLDRKAFVYAKLAFICLNVYESLSSCLMNTKKEFNAAEDADMTRIRDRIEEGHYENYKQFENDVFSVLRNAVNRFDNDVNNEFVQFINETKNSYYHILTEYLHEIDELERELKVKEKVIEPLVDGDGDGDSKGTSDTNEKTVKVNDAKKTKAIECFCNMYDDDCDLVMCQSCRKHQHAFCMHLETTNIVAYKCYTCEPREYDKERVLKTQPEDALSGLTYYHTLSRDADLLLTIGQCVYVMKDRENLITSEGRVRTVPKQILNTMTAVDCDILRVEHLWINESGDKFASGYYYIRPTDTFHESSKRFFKNELLKYPVEDVFPIAAAIRQCHVTDSMTYSKGKPKNLKSLADYYICDFKVDKKARSFSKYKHKYSLNTKQYSFDSYSERLKIKRDYQPHSIEIESKKALSSSDNSIKTIKHKKKSSAESKKAENLNNIIAKLKIKNRKSM